MKITDLIIGDYVRVVGNNTFHTPNVMSCLPCIAKITSISSDATVEVDMIPDDEYFYIDEIEPIRLTPEILEKNSIILKNLNELDFEVLFNDYGDASLAKRVSNSKHGYHDFEYICDVIYVYQLQHALKLCGIDKEIVL